MTDIISPLPFTLTNGQVADASQVMADFNEIRNDVNSQVPVAIAAVGVGATKQVSISGQTANGSTMTLPARSIVVFVTFEETAGFSTVGNMVVSPGTVQQTPAKAHLAINLTPTDNGSGISHFWSASPVTVSVTNTNWNGASVNTTLFYVTL